MLVACEACDAADVLKNEHGMLLVLLNVVLHSFDTFEADCSRRAVLLVIGCELCLMNCMDCNVLSAHTVEADELSG